MYMEPLGYNQTRVHYFYFGVGSFFRSAPKMLLRSAPKKGAPAQNLLELRSVAPCPGAVAQVWLQRLNNTLEILKV